MNSESDVSGLVRAAVAGDGVAWEGLVARYSPLVLSVVRGYRLSDDDVADVVQGVWLRLVEHLWELREPRALPGWLVTTSRNETLRRLKARSRVWPVAVVFDGEGGPLVDGGVVGGSLDEDLLRVERREALLEAFGGLGDRDRALMWLLFADPPVSYVEIGRRLGMSVGSIGPTRSRVLEKLRAHPAVSALATNDATSEASQI